MLVPIRTVLEVAMRRVVFWARRPLIVIEMAMENAESCAAIFRANDYGMLSAHEPDPAKTFEEIDTLWDVLAAPREQLAGLVGK